MSVPQNEMEEKFLLAYADVSKNVDKWCGEVKDKCSTIPKKYIALENSKNITEFIEKRNGMFELLREYNEKPPENQRNRYADLLKQLATLRNTTNSKENIQAITKLESQIKQTESEYGYAKIEEQEFDSTLRQYFFYALEKSSNELRNEMKRIGKMNFTNSFTLWDFITLLAKDPGKYIRIFFKSITDPSEEYKQLKVKENYIKGIYLQVAERKEELASASINRINHMRATIAEGKEGFVTLDAGDGTFKRFGNDINCQDIIDKSLNASEQDIKKRVRIKNFTSLLKGAAYVAVVTGLAVGTFFTAGLLIPFIVSCVALAAVSVAGIQNIKSTFVDFNKEAKANTWARKMYLEKHKSQEEKESKFQDEEPKVSLRTRFGEAKREINERKKENIDDEIDLTPSPLVLRYQLTDHINKQSQALQTSEAQETHIDNIHSNKP